MGVLADMHPEIEWHQAQGLPHGGTYHGLDEVRRNIFEPLDVQWWDEFSAEPDEFLDAGGEVVVLGRYRGIAKETGKRLDVPFVHIWTLRRGAGGSFSPVPRHRGLGRGARDLIIDTVSVTEDDSRLQPNPGIQKRRAPTKEDT